MVLSQGWQEGKREKEERYDSRKGETDLVLQWNSFHQAQAGGEWCLKTRCFLLVEKYRQGQESTGWRCGSKLKSWQGTGVDDIEGASWLCNAQAL